MNIALPPITVLIPTLNEEKHIRDCIESLVQGEYPAELLEILVIDGGSVDETQQITASIGKTHSSVKLLENPKKIVPAALNLGITAAKNDILVWVGAHARYSTNYLTRSVQTLLETDCASVGGVLRAIGDTPFSSAIAVATNSKFGVGNAMYRHAHTRQSVDTVFGGCWRKSSIHLIGGFNEDWVRNQDYELNLRLRQTVGEIIVDPDIKCDYFCRGTLSSLAKQYFQYGFWRFQTVMKRPESFSFRLAAPPALLIGLLASTAIAPFSPIIALILPAIYFASIVSVTTYQCIAEASLSLFLRLPTIYATLHLSWALGFLSGSKKMIGRSPLSEKL